MVWAVVFAWTSIILGTITLFLIAYAVRLKLRSLSHQEMEKLNRLLNSMEFWSLLGAIFGAIGAVLVIRITGLPETESMLWVVFGFVAGLVWGALWGAVWAVTSR